MPRRKQKADEPDLSQQKLEFSGMSYAEIQPVHPLKPQEKTTYTVSELTALLAHAWEAHPVLGDTVVVEGEVSNVKQSARGHIYFTLKDENAAIGGILWASTVNRLNFTLESGQAVYLTGRLEIYRPSGTYSIVASKIEPVGIGALQLAFQQIKARLDAEGLFCEEYKKPLPDFPERIGIVTSSTGAVIHDMLRVIRRKNPLVDVLLHPVKVQGEGAALEIANAINELNDPHYALDLIIVGRGGGSFEDLFCFSEEPVVRAVFESDVPIITGIGHEPDYSLADAAADYSASTPTAAADWAVPDAQYLVECHAENVRSLLEGIREALLEAEQRLDVSATRLVEMHESCLELCQTRLDQKAERLSGEFSLLFQRQEQRLAQAASTLEAFSPLATLSRGYALPSGKEGRLIRAIDDIQTGDALSLRLSDGHVDCTVQAKRPLASKAAQTQPPA